jgi:hypothetical protein
MWPCRIGPLRSSGIIGGRAQAGENSVATMIEAPAARANLKGCIVLTCLVASPDLSFVFCLCRITRLVSPSPAKKEHTKPDARASISGIKVKH